MTSPTVVAATKNVATTISTLVVQQFPLTSGIVIVLFFVPFSSLFRLSPFVTILLRVSIRTTEVTFLRFVLSLWLRIMFISAVAASGMAVLLLLLLLLLLQ